MIGAGRLYTISFTAVAITAVQDLFSFIPASNIPCALEAIYVSNVGGINDAGDAQEELLRIEINRRAAMTLGSGGSTPTIAKIYVNDATASFTTHVNDTTGATGTATLLHADGWNNRIPYIWLPPPEHRPIVANSAGISVQLVLAPNDSMNVSGSCYIRELS